jgi:hypothetical protein
MDKSGNAIEDYGIYGGWKNFIGDLKPGEGYKVNVTSAATLTITEGGPKSAVILAQPVALSHFKPEFKGNGLDHMNINLVNLSESDIEVGDEIGIFDGNICVGGVRVTKENSTHINLIASATDGEGEKHSGFVHGNIINLKLYRNGVEQTLELIPVNSTIAQFEKNGTLFANVNTALSTVSEMQENEFDVQFYPNPFNEILNLEIKLPQRQELTVEVYDLLSRRVTQLYDGQAEGLIKLQWDGKDSGGSMMAPGIYMCRVNGLLKKVVLN